MYQTEPPIVNRLNLPKDATALDIYVTQQIKSWRDKPKEERLALAYSREEIRRMPSRERLVVIDNGIVSGLIHLYANNPKMDLAPGVLTMIIMLSDNDDYGAAYISTSSLGELLSRKRNAVARALAKLVDEGLLISEERSHTSTLYHPVLSKEFTSRASIYDIMSVYSPPKVNKGGRPRKVHPVEISHAEETPALTVGAPLFNETPAPSGGARVFLETETPAPVEQNPCTDIVVHDSPKNIPNNKNGGIARGSDWAVALNPTAATAKAQCWRDAQGIVHVDGDFKTELLERVSNDGALLRDLLDIAGGWGTSLHGLALMNRMRSSIMMTLASRKTHATGQLRRSGGPSRGASTMEAYRTLYGDPQ